MTPTIESHPDAPEGEVSRLTCYVPETFVYGSAILCRNTAPLVAFAYSLMQRDIRCRILGKDIGASLIATIKKLRPIDLSDFLEKLKVWEQREVDRAIKDDRNPERIYDQSECLRFFVDSLDEESRTVDSLIAKIELMFTDERNGESRSRITLSTVHKAKGLEFPIVFILDFNKYMPSRFAQKEWQKRQENNLIYVAVTRSMDKLYYINTDCWKE